MSRTALARKYRPRRFSELSRQEHVAETLTSAVARGRVAHAYLFCGPRGVGKTTAARVLAMALNCPNRGEDGEPCGECESCERIWAGRTSLDVVEIDAASNRGVDDARDLRERAMYAPTDEHRYKVYIIDEAHMLTREAWNALLKILEEPPPRVIFVFATTEPQKIQQAAPPILSRCQRFDFRRIGVSAIVERLQQVVDGEGLEADPAALTAIARRAEGGLRDALSLLDQVLAVAQERLSAEDVQRLLGIVDEELYIELFDILAEHRHADVFRFVQRVIDEGYDLTEFYRGLADALRLRLIVALEGGDDIAVRDDLRPRIEAQARRFSTGDLLRMLSQVAELDVEGRFRKSGNPRILLETLLLRFCHFDRTVELEALIQAVGDAAGAGGSGSPPGSPPPGRGQPQGSGAGEATARGAAPPGTKAGAARNAAPRAGGSAARPETPRASAAPAREPPDASAQAAGQSLEAAFRALVDRGDGLPAGLGVFLRAARVREADDAVHVALPEGPGLERLRSDDVARRSLQRALSERLGREVTLRVDAAGSQGGGGADDRGAKPVRLTPERVRADRLARLTREEPALKHVVEAWDLELME